MNTSKGNINTVLIGFKNYNIEQPEEIPALIDHQNSGCYGMCCYDDSKIIIAHKYEQHDKNQTFIHELLHGICYRFGLNELNHDEHTIDLLSLGIYELICGNPHIFLMADI